MKQFSIQIQVLGLIGWLVLCYAVSAFGAVASIQAREFYGELLQPAWAPPSWVFGPVWTLLYGMMAVAAWLVWRSGGFRVNRGALSLFLTQLAVNGLWSWLFFAWHMGGLALLDISCLWALIIVTAIAFWRVRPAAGILLLPYLLWVSFAALLNLAVWLLNPDIL